MLFVPLPLFATLCLVFVLIQMGTTRDMGVRANQLFGGLVALYALQSLLLCLRWGYGVDGVGLWIAMLAPVLPVCAYFAYLSLINRLSLSMMWPLGIVVLNWAVLLVLPDVADPVILLTYLGFGIAILRRARVGGDRLALVRIGQTDGALRAMVITGAALICSALADSYVIFDFIRTGGQNVGMAITLLQSAFLLCIGLAAITGHSGAVDEVGEAQSTGAPIVTQEDDEIITRLQQLFERDALHRDTELNLRRLARRLGVPDRSVSQAVNRTQGMSVSQYVNGFRIKDACEILAQTDQTILQVSMAAGFLTKSNFNREFLRVTGQTPSGWRKGDH